MFVRLFLAGGVGALPGSDGGANLMGWPVEFDPAAGAGLAVEAPDEIAGSGTADAVLLAAAVVGVGGGIIGDAEDAGAGFGRLRER